MLKVLVVDDFPLFRRGVRDLLGEGFKDAKIGEAGDAHEMLKLLRLKPWDVAILDISMPGMNGLDALKQVKQEFPDLPVLILSMYPEEQYAIRTIKALMVISPNPARRRNWSTRLRRYMGAVNM